MFPFTSPLTGLWLALAALLTPHPHHPKAIKLQGAAGVVTCSYFTVPFNPEQMTSLQPGFDWHLGFAVLDTDVGLRCKDVAVPAGKYKLDVRRGGDADTWQVVLIAHELRMAEYQVQRAERRGQAETVAAAAAALAEIRAELSAAGRAEPLLLPLTAFAAGRHEHLEILGIHRGYRTVQRGSTEPAGGMECSLQIGFGDLHRELHLEELFAAAEAGDKK